MFGAKGWTHYGCPAPPPAAATIPSTIDWSKCIICDKSLGKGKQFFSPDGMVCSEQCLAELATTGLRRKEAR
jgi:hypothetical protein